MAATGRMALIVLALIAVERGHVLFAQVPKPVPLTESGQVMVAGHTSLYVIRHLPVSSFPDLPVGVADQLKRRGCAIPQTYEAHGPENVVHGSFELAGSSDWAVLCSVQGTVSLLVFFGETAGGQPMTLKSARESERLQAHGADGVLGFDWAIDPASPQRVHEAQVGLVNRPELADHDALADSVVDQRTVYRFYAKGVWSELEMPNQ